MKKSSMLLIGIFGLALAIVLPVSWKVMQAELAQSRNMRAMGDQLDVMERMSGDCRLEPLQKAAQDLTTASMQIDGAFAYLSEGSKDFRLLSAAMRTQAKRFSDQSKTAGCAVLTELSTLKNQCKQCHEQFRTKRPPTRVERRAPTS